MIDLDGLELGYKQGGHNGIDVDIIPYNSSSFDVGNKIACQNWDKMVANEFLVFSDERLKNNIQKVGNEVRTESEHLSMNYMELIPHFIKGIQEQQEQIDELKAELKNLKK